MFFFLGEFLTEVFGLRRWPLPWVFREILQLAAGVGLLFGTWTSLLLVRHFSRRRQEVEDQLEIASGAFFSMIEKKFSEWALSKSEREVALYAIRGYPNSEIADIRGKSEATIKSQIGAIFKKANVTNRSELLSEFIELLIENPISRDKK
jgi:DNA-binding CsgD family transcriptional regulator